jgi:GDP-L-fucose synthase
MREFLWSEDLADACVFILENVNFEDLKKGKEEVRNCHINIGTGREISIKDLALLTADIVGYTGRIKFNPLMPDGTMRKLTDVSKLKSLGWQYKVELDEGIRRMYQWYISDQEENECENVTGE